MNSAPTPLWIELKNEYLDDNITRLIPYLRDANKRDSFYAVTLDLLQQRIQKLLDTLSHQSLDAADQADTPTLQRQIQLLTVYLLSSPAEQRQLPFAALLVETILLAPKFSQELFATFLRALSYENVTEIGIGYDDILYLENTDILAYKLCHNARFANPRLHAVARSLTTGSALFSQKGVFLADYDVRQLAKNATPSAAALSLLDGLYVLSSDKKERLSDAAQNTDALDRFLTSFLAVQKNAKPASTPHLRHYNEDDEVMVRLVEVVRGTKTENGRIKVQTVDPNYQTLTGYIVFEGRSILYYYNSMFTWWLNEGDLVKVRVKDPDKATFSFSNTFVDFIVNDTRDHYFRTEQAARLLDIRSTFSVWITENGIPVFTPPTDLYNRDDYAIVKVTEIGTGKYLGRIEAEIVDDIYDESDRFEESVARKNCMRDFVLPTDTLSPADASLLDPTLLYYLLQALFAYQKHLIHPSQRAFVLTIARLLAEMLGENDTSAYIDFVYAYLKTLVLFTQGKSLTACTLPLPKTLEALPSARLRYEVVELLKQYEATDNNAFLQQKITTYTTDNQPFLLRLARLIEATGTMHSLQCDAFIGLLKHEIIKMLQMEASEEEDDLECDNAIYLGVESSSVEFKESVVFPPDNAMQPDENRQIRNVLRSVCAFLNASSGGTLYIGVTDQGYVKGISSDLNYLHVNPDEYMRCHIQDPAIDLLGLDAASYLRFELLYDQQVVAIHIESLPHRIVTLEGKSYLRINAESREVTSEIQRQQILNRKIFTRKEISARLSYLYQAMSTKCQAILHQCVNETDNTVTDHTVEVYHISSETRLASVFDLSDNTCKCFDLNQIASVEVTDTPSSHQALYKPLFTDAFHCWSSEPGKNCRLQLDLTARAALVERFPLTEKDITRLPQGNLFVLDTPVCHLQGIARFYLSMADHVTPLSCPGLQEYLPALTSHLPVRSDSMPRV